MSNDQTIHNPRFPVTFKRALIRWFWICAAGAAPSFYWGLNFAGSRNILPMLAGIGIFIVAYASLDSSTSVYRWRRNMVVHSALAAAFSARVIFTLMIPFSVSIDGICGLASIQLIESISPSLLPLEPIGDVEQVSFLATFVLTLVQGLVLNCLVLAVALIFASIQCIIILITGESFREQY